MSDEILDKIKKKQQISANEIKKETQGLKSVTEGFTVNYFSVETSTKQEDKDNDQ
ncbi:MAG: hypothetical protein RSB52_08820 [Acidaminococcaceae bacterium]